MARSRGVRRQRPLIVSASIRTTASAIIRPAHAPSGMMAANRCRWRPVANVLPGRASTVPKAKAMKAPSHSRSRAGV